MASIVTGFMPLWIVSSFALIILMRVDFICNEIIVYEKKSGSLLFFSLISTIFNDSIAVMSHVMGCIYLA